MKVETISGLVEVEAHPIVIRIEFTPYLCCDDCNDVYQNEMWCPVCQTVTVSDWYDDLFRMDLNNVLHCNKCKTGFRLVSKDDKYDPGYLHYLWKVPA